MPIRSKGRFLIGGVDIRRLTPEQLNKPDFCCFRDVWLFDDTLLANIRIARPQATRQEVEAARAAQLLLSLFPSSARLADANGRDGRPAIGRRAPADFHCQSVIEKRAGRHLDEPTAALDIESELAVQSDRALVHNRTVIIIAHRLSTIAGAGNILVMEEGRSG